jgi:hypothetical protein
MPKDKLHIQNRRIVHFVVAALCLVFLGVGAVNAQDQDHPRCYTVESLKGPYAIIGHYGDHLALALTEGQFEGKGNFTSTFIVNEPIPHPQPVDGKWSAVPRAAPTPLTATARVS